MNSNYITRALCFHGQPMQKIWEDERGMGDLQKLGVPKQPNYSVYQERQKDFTFQDRAKRLKLHQFLTTKASDLYDAELESSVGVAADDMTKKSSHIAIMPPYEVFVSKTQDKARRYRCVLEAIKPGDIIYGMVIKANVTSTPIMIKPLCTAEPLVRYLADIPVKASLPYANIRSPPLDKNGKSRGFQVNDYVCCEVCEISVDADRLTLSMQSVFSKNKNIKLGSVGLNELPTYYRKSIDNTFELYENCLCTSKEFLNPNYDILFEMNGLQVNETFTLMSSLKYPFPKEEYAKELRQAQISKWAFRSVVEGVEYFKNGFQCEAFQCLNKALCIDPVNVEGLVARGALYANKGSFLKAVDDFRLALKLNSNHVNARKYLAETLVALGRSFEDEGLMQDAINAYTECLEAVPNHEQAISSLKNLKHRPDSALFENLLNIPDLRSKDHEKKKKRNSSSSSVGNSSGSNSSESDTDNTDPNKFKKEDSMSPLSKRMALHAATIGSAAPPNQAKQAYYQRQHSTEAQSKPMEFNDFQLDEDDTKIRVRKLLQEASKHKKEKSKKDKKKKSKKPKKDAKNKESSVLLNKVQQAYKAITGANFEKSLTNNLKEVEKSIADIKKRQEILEQSTSNNSNQSYSFRISDSPPPKPPPFKIQQPASTSTKPDNTKATPKFSFQIKKPTKVDKMGLRRLATPLLQKSPTPPAPSPKRVHRSPSPSPDRHSHSRSRSRSRSRHRDRSRQRRVSRRRSRSVSYERRRRRRSSHSSRSRSKSRSNYGRRTHRRRSSSTDRNGKFRGRRRRTPSPFVARGSPPRYRSSRPGFKPSIRGTTKGFRPIFCNRVWQRPGYTAPENSSERTSRDKSPNGAWLHDKFDKSD